MSNRKRTNSASGEISVSLLETKFGFANSVKTLCSLWSNKHIKKALNCFRACGDKWTRTIDSRIFSPMLYQLSYITLL